MPHKTTTFFIRNCHDYGAQDEALRPPACPPLAGTERAGQRFYFSKIPSGSFCVG